MIAPGVKVNDLLATVGAVTNASEEGSLVLGSEFRGRVDLPEIV
jgi:hypothetical protein